MVSCLLSPVHDPYLMECLGAKDLKGFQNETYYKELIKKNQAMIEIF